MKWVSQLVPLGILFGLCLSSGCKKQVVGIPPAPPPPIGVVAVSSVPWDVPESMKKKTIRNQGRAFSEKTVAFTFDDGPSPNNTPKVLDILDKYGIKATFFLVGLQMQSSPNLVKEVMNRGHVIGNHTFTHSWHPQREMALKEFVRWESLLKELTGRETHLFRPPFGRTNSAFSLVALQRGYPLILWTNSGADTGTKKRDTLAQKAQSVYDNVVGNIHPGDIVILHDNADKAHTVQALPRIIEALKKKGYGFVTVPELLQGWEKAREKAKEQKSKGKSAKPDQKSRPKSPYKTALTTFRSKETHG